MSTPGNDSKLVALQGRNVCFNHYARRKRTPVLRGVDITIEKGVTYGLLGPSGCGKTTLLRCIVGRLKPSDGHLRVYGKIPGEPGFCIPGRGIGYMPQELALYPEITTEETLTYFGRLYHMSPLTIKERIDFLVKLLDIPNKKTLIKNLSGGQQRRVSFAVASIHRPPFLVLDEPTVGVDPLLRQSIWGHLQALVREDHVTVLITTHYIEEARQANVVGLMRNGRLLTQMNPEDLIREHQVFTLEDVFLKLCHKDSEENEMNPDNYLIPLTPETANDGVPDIWIPQRTRPMHHINAEIKVTTNSIYSESYSQEYLPLNESPDIENILILNRKDRQKAAVERLGALISKNFLRFSRNIPFAFFQIFVPAIQVIVFCLCVGGEPFDLPFAIVNEETAKEGFGELFLENLSNVTFRQETYENLSLAIESVKEGRTWGALYIGPEFTTSLIQRFIEGTEVDNETIDASEIKLYLDMTNQQIAATVYASTMKSFQSFAESMLTNIHKNPRLAEPPIMITNPVYGKQDTNFTEFMAPGMILGIVYIMAVGLTAMSIIIEKKEGLLERSWVAGVTPGEVIFSITFTLFLVMLLQIFLVLILTFFVFDIPTHGSVFWAVVCVALVGICGIAYGLFISAICDDENAAMMVAMGSFYPTLLLSGIIWPIEAMSHYLRYFSLCLPLTLISNTFRSILSRGWSIAEHHIWDGLIISLGWTVFFILLAEFIFRCRK